MCKLFIGYTKTVNLHYTNIMMSCWSYWLTSCFQLLEDWPSERGCTLQRSSHSQVRHHHWTVVKEPC